MDRTPVRIDGYAPIADYAAIGNKRTVALVAADGSVDWFCPGGFGAPSALGALLDSADGGTFALAPTEAYTVQRRYLPGTNVLQSTFTTARGSVRITDAMSLPATRALDFTEIIRLVDGLGGEVPMGWAVRPRFDYGRTRGEVVHRGGVPVIVGGQQMLAVQAHGAGIAEGAHGNVHGTFTCAAGTNAVLALSAFTVGPLAYADAEQLRSRVDATVAHWEQWTQGCTYDGPWRGAVLRSALALDLMVDEQRGAIIAAPTMGLPERIGGARNYDYRYAWLRDGNLTLEAMLRLGFVDQVHASLRWMFHTTAHTHPRVQPMYRVDGRGVPDGHDLDHLHGYRGSRPVTRGNAARSQLQLGCYGDIFDMAWHYVEAGNALDAGVGVRMAELADYVCLVWDRPDAGLWELDDQQHFTQSKLGCELTLKRAQQLAERDMLPRDRVDRWAATQAAIQRFVRERCWSDRLKAYTRAADSEELDAAVLLASRGSFLADEPSRLSSTIDAVLLHLGVDGGPLIYRYTGMAGQEGAFLACSFWAAEALARCGRGDEGAAMFESLLAVSNDVGLYSEEIDAATGTLLGNMPQALTHLALINAADVCGRDRSGR
ncbi:glycoside hydrolase family 15 protein [Baekduia soli]|uniref:Glycoside hydrolase family 15 protein n=1 Tax=Baekduia soli TaxID=496014 RepID=A0A5B8U5S3_9ACTN|nr:glycoside hydrolase family 15 protein [Baekduia soli]QEC48235.1 glycoside hydrolase family 15 protein [Baekduia soli]